MQVLAESVRRMEIAPLPMQGDTVRRPTRPSCLTGVRSNLAFALDQALLFWPPYQATDPGQRDEANNGG